MKKITEYIINGVKNENESVFMNRIGELLEKNGLLELFTEGVPVAVEVYDPVGLELWLNSLCRSGQAMFFKATVENDFRVRVRYKYTETRYFKTQKEAEKGDRYSSRSAESEEYCWPGEVEQTTSTWVEPYNEVPGLKVVYI